MENNYLKSVILQFEYYKLLGEKAMEQVSDDNLFWKYNVESNSIANIVNHLSGNMLSRWTDFLISDGEKDWRNRDAEFEDLNISKTELLEKWKEGWECLLNTLKSLNGGDLRTIIYIRNQGHTVQEAINRQLAHYPYHIGQIILLGKMLSPNWQSLSIPKGKSNGYNNEKFSETKQRKHFTQEYLIKK